MTKEEKDKIKRPLSDPTIKNLKAESKRYEILDYDGLYVVVEPSGKKTFRYFWDHRKGQFTIGEYIPSKYGIALARKKRDEVKALIQEGKDPKKHYADLKEKERESKKKGLRFSEVVAQFLEDKERSGTVRPSTMLNIKRRVKRHILPELGGCVIQEMTRTGDIIPFLKRLNAKGVPSEAVKIKGHLEEIFEFAFMHGWTEERNVTYGTRLLFDAVPKTEHFPGVSDPVLFGEILRRIDTYSGRTRLQGLACALRLLPLVFMRANEVASIRWADIDFSAKIIRKRAEEMKNGEAFEVPLSRQALAILEEAKAHAGQSEWAFPSFKAHEHFNCCELRRALRLLGIPADVQSAHGFRTSAVTLISERFGDEFSMEVREAALSHKPKVELGDTYIRARYIERRTTMMQKWADYCDEMKAGKHGLPPSGLWPTV